MAKKQKWNIELGGEMHTVEYAPCGLLRRARITIDGSVYPLYSARLFGASAEAFMLGGEMASIEIARGGVAKIYVSGELIPENSKKDN